MCARSSCTCSSLPRLVDLVAVSRLPSYSRADARHPFVQVILINGLTKCWRLPGWRVCWVVGPKSLIRALGQSGGFLDGGASHVLQVAALPLLDRDRVKQDRVALQSHFRAKRDYVVERLRKMGFAVKNAPTSTFYVWLDLSELPEPLDNGLVFFEEALKEKVIVVPGTFFDLSASSSLSLVAAGLPRSS